MRKRLHNLFTRLSWAQRFLLVSLVIFVMGMFGMGWWVGQQIESGVVQQTAANTALYVSSMVEPNLQELASGDSIMPEHQAALGHLLQGTALGQDITAFRVWDKQGRIVFTADLAGIGQVLPPSEGLAHALRGWVASDISNLDKPENGHAPDRGNRRLVTYSPVRRTGTNDIIAAVEFYQPTDGLDRAITEAQQRSWLIVSVVTLGMYLLLAGFVRYASDTIRRQQNKLSDQVVQLSTLLAQNEELHERIRRATRRTTALNERFLRRISAELHDGPAQDLGLALLRLDHLLPCSEQTLLPLAQNPGDQHDFQVVQSSLRHALQEIRAISAGMGLPELEHLTLAETAVRAVRAHERRTGVQVALHMNGVPEHMPVSVKITVYRIIQEALNNAYRHAAAANPQVHVDYAHNRLDLIISDQGPGFDETREAEWDEHLGLVGMRERVESLGGSFQVESAVGCGTRVIAQLALDVTEREQ